MGYVAAFKKYGAKLTNPQWSVSAFGSDGSLVLALWQHLVKGGEVKGALVYRDSLSQWRGNKLGRAELANHLRAAQASNLPVKLVTAVADSDAEAAQVGEISDESDIKKSFAAADHLIGRIESFDSDTLCIHFKRAG